MRRWAIRRAPHPDGRGLGSAKGWLILGAIAVVVAAVGFGLFTAFGDDNPLEEANQSGNEALIYGFQADVSLCTLDCDVDTLTQLEASTEEVIQLARNDPNFEFEESAGRVLTIRKSSRTRPQI